MLNEATILKGVSSENWHVLQTIPTDQFQSIFLTDFSIKDLCEIEPEGEVKEVFENRLFDFKLLLWAVHTNEYLYTTNELIDIQKINKNQ